MSAIAASAIMASCSGGDAKSNPEPSDALKRVMCRNEEASREMLRMDFNCDDYRD